MWFLLSLALAAPPSWIEDGCELTAVGQGGGQLSCPGKNLSVQAVPAEYPAAQVLDQLVTTYSKGMAAEGTTQQVRSFAFEGAVEGRVLTSAGKEKTNFLFLLARPAEVSTRVVGCNVRAPDEAAALAACKPALRDLLASGMPMRHLRVKGQDTPGIRAAFPDYAPATGCTLEESPVHLQVRCVDGMAHAMVLPRGTDLLARSLEGRDDMLAALAEDGGPLEPGKRTCKVLGRDTVCWTGDRADTHVVFAAWANQEMGVVLQCTWGHLPTPCEGLIEGL